MIEEKAAGPEAVDRFKEAFKRYKKKNTDLSDAIDLSRPPEHRSELRLQDPVIRSNDDAAELGLIPTHQWRIYCLTPTPGVLVIPNPFIEGGQHYWLRRCLVDYPCLPNICNIDAHFKREGAGRVWPGGRSQSWNEEVLKKLRWTTLGYHYDWSAKVYHEDRKSLFPSDLAGLSTFILSVAGFPGFLAEAAIVNFYHLDSALSGHTDHSERDLSHPLLSISYGQSAVFLVGGERKSVSPQAIVLHSGDVLIMSGPSRLAYHGVPRIIAPSTPIPPALRRTSLLHHLERCRVGPCRLKSGVPCRVCETERELQQAGGGDSSTDDTPARKRLKTEQEGEVAVVEPEVAKPEVVEPEVVKPEVAKPEVAKPEVAKPEVVEPEVAKPEVVEPEVVKPEVAKPEVVEPEVVKPEVAKPEVVEPEVVKPEVAKPESSACEELSDVLREWTDFESYISTSRINVNIRQVNKAHRYSPIT